MLSFDRRCFGLGKIIFFPVRVGEPLECIRNNYADDPNTSKIRSFMTSWYEEFKDEPVTVADAIDLATE